MSYNEEFEIMLILIGSDFVSGSRVAVIMSNSLGGSEVDGVSIVGLDGQI